MPEEEPTSSNIKNFSTVNNEMVGNTVESIYHQAYKLEQRKLPSEVDEV